MLVHNQEQKCSITLPSRLVVLPNRSDTLSPKRKKRKISCTGPFHVHLLKLNLVLEVSGLALFMLKVVPLGSCQGW